MKKVSIAVLLFIAALISYASAQTTLESVDIPRTLQTFRKKAGIAPRNANMRSPIRLDKKYYAWTDKIRITVFAPEWNTRRHGIDTIGADREHAIKVATREKELKPFKLVETGPDTGVFAGEVYLTGFALDVDGDGRSDTTPRTSGTGPVGYLENKGRDAFTVTWKYSRDRSYTASAAIGMNEGVLAFDAGKYRLGERATLRLVDPDLNLRPDSPDQALIDIFSDSDQAGIRAIATEVGSNSGVFDVRIIFSNSRASSGDRLHVQPGDRIEAHYKDRTLPPPAGRRDIRTISAKAQIER